MLSSLGNSNVQDAIFEIGRHVVLVDASREAEGARKLANAALGEPVLGRVGRLVFLRGLCDFALTFGCVLDGRLVRRWLVLDGSSGGVALYGAGRRSAGGIGPLDFALDKQGLRVGELNVDIFLAHAGQFAVELISSVGLAHIELGLPVGEAGAATLDGAIALSRVVVKVLEKAEERGEGGVGRVKVALEERHVASWYCGERS